MQLLQARKQCQIIQRADGPLRTCVDFARIKGFGIGKCLGPVDIQTLYLCQIFGGQCAIFFTGHKPDCLFDQRFRKHRLLRGAKPVGIPADCKSSQHKQDCCSQPQCCPLRPDPGGPFPDPVKSLPYLTDLFIPVIRRKSSASVDDILQRCIDRDIPVLPYAPCHHPAQQNAKRIDICPRIGLTKTVLFRRSVPLRTEKHGVRSRAVLYAAGDIEIDQHDLPVRLHDQILRFDIAMHHCRLMHVQDFQNITQTLRDRHDIFHRKLPFPGIVRKRLSLNVFPHDAEHLIVLKLLIIPGQTRMAQFPQQRHVRPDRKNPAVIAGGNRHFLIRLALYKKRLPSRMTCQTFHLVICRQKIRGISAFREHRFHILYNMFEFVHFSRPPSSGN